MFPFETIGSKELEAGQEIHTNLSGCNIEVRPIGQCHLEEQRWWDTSTLNNNEKGETFFFYELCNAHLLKLC